METQIRSVITRPESRKWKLIAKGHDEILGGVTGTFSILILVVVSEFVFLLTKTHRPVYFENTF